MLHWSQDASTGWTRNSWLGSMATMRSPRSYLQLPELESAEAARAPADAGGIDGPESTRRRSRAHARDHVAVRRPTLRRPCDRRRACPACGCFAGASTLVSRLAPRLHAGEAPRAAPDTAAWIRLTRRRGAATLDAQTRPSSTVTPTTRISPRNVP